MFAQLQGHCTVASHGTGESGPGTNGAAVGASILPVETLGSCRHRPRVALVRQKVDRNRVVETRAWGVTEICRSVLFPNRTGSQVHEDRLLSGRTR